MYLFQLPLDIFIKYQPCDKHGEYSVLGNLDFHLQGPKSNKDMVSINNIFSGFFPIWLSFCKCLPNGVTGSLLTHITIAITTWHTYKTPILCLHRRIQW